MARLAITKGVLAEYAKLDKGVQNAVETAITEFAKDPNPGSQLEKVPCGRDDRIRTIRVDGVWRGVVLAPDGGDTYCLLTVLPQEKAIGYAASHRFSVNPSTGMLEMSNEIAIQQLQPSLQAAAGPADKRLFADVSHADLTRLGIDAQILPLVRLLTSDADLETLQSVLPDAQYTALYALARGMTVDEAWAEATQPLPACRPDSWTQATWSPPWNAHQARSPSSPGRRNCSSSSPTRSQRGGRSCTRVSARSPTGRATPARLK